MTKPLAASLLGAALALTGTAPAAAAPAAEPAKIALSAVMDGAHEVPGPGDDAGGGTFAARIDPATGQLCYSMTVRGLTAPTAAHIHQGAPDVAGPHVVVLDTPADGKAGGCMAVDPALAASIAEHPADYYVNVHTDAFAKGAIRGQLAGG